jgi:hypothetical protein
MVFAQLERTVVVVKTAPDGQSTSCQVVETKADLLATLKKVGWSNGGEPPISIDWEKECAVIIAPRAPTLGNTALRNNPGVRFVSLRWDGAHYVLTWEPSGFSNGSETLIVAIEHTYHADDRLRCQDNAGGGGQDVKLTAPVGHP